MKALDSHLTAAAPPQWREQVLSGISNLFVTTSCEASLIVDMKVLARERHRCLVLRMRSGGWKQNTYPVTHGSHGKLVTEHTLLRSSHVLRWDLAALRVVYLQRAAAAAALLSDITALSQDDQIPKSTRKVFVFLFTWFQNNVDSQCQDIKSLSAFCVCVSFSILSPQAIYKDVYLPIRYWLIPPAS